MRVKEDFLRVTVIGAAVGLLSQPILVNLVDAPSIFLRLGIFFVFLAFAPFALWVGYVLGKLWSPIYQFAKFGAVGTLNFFVDAGVLNTAILLTGIASGIAYPLFKTVSFFAATTNSFFWNKHWTFGAGMPHTLKETLKFYLVALLGGAANIGIASYVVNGMARPEFASPNLWANIGALTGIFGSLVIDFLGYKYLVFSDKRQLST